MIKILSINGTSYYSTGNIIKTIEKELLNEYIFYRITADEEEDKNFKNPRNYFERQIGKVVCQSFGIDGFGFSWTNRRVNKYISSIKPDIIHIHNVHGYWINLENIINYASKNNIPIVYTLHDCWTFTGRCAHFFNVNCNEWKNGCKKCIHKDSYPRVRFFSFSQKQWLKKRDLLTNKNIVFVSPSFWLKNYFEHSFLKNENITVVNNGVDCPFLQNTKAEKIIDTNKRIILSVANPFTPEKGLVEINQLSKLVDDRYVIVCVGNSFQGKFSNKIINIPSTKNKELLAKIYKQAYCFCLFSHQENYPTVLMESIVCGTPVITFDVGGCKEICKEGINGFLVKNNYNDIVNKINQVELLDRQRIAKDAQKHSIKEFAQKYKEIYNRLINENKNL